MGYGSDIATMEKQMAFARGQLNGGSMLAATAGEAPRPPELAEQVQKLEKAVAYAEESLNELTSRLGGILRPAAPEPAPVGNQLSTVGPSTAYGMQLHEQYARVGRIADRLQDLLRRIEV